MQNEIQQLDKSKPLDARQERELRYARKNAVQQAWKKESDYVRQGKGTRDWSPAQQEDILNNGHVAGYEGHHMRSVGYGKTYDEQIQIASNKNNIQFLEKTGTNNEHLAAHNGNYRNRTNGYYDYTTNTTKSFGNQQPVPPKAYDLSNPIINNKSSASSSDNVKSYDTATNAYRSQAPPVTATDTSKISPIPNEDKPKGAVDTDKNNNFYDAKVPSNKDKDTDPLASNLDKQNNGMKM